ncbi:hypothetical protein [Halobacteriovorax sp. HLS]|uniref:hypothetical protein n=1 Tax=Halobacteriovorax sp. HLS TaxID=2234000 RepID=UPI000FDA81DA|nr:hypothetical protein [Halobacteriovorax sp. HLS]
MKLMIMTLALVMTFTVNANVAFTVNGKLVPYNGSSDLIHMVLLTKGGNFNVVSFDHKIQTCENGEFEIVQNFYPKNTYSLVEIYDCNDKIDDGPTYCPEVYMPICGSIDLKQRTFGNYCELTSSGADFLYAGQCEE